MCIPVDSGAVYSNLMAVLQVSLPVYCYLTDKERLKIIFMRKYPVIDVEQTGKKLLKECEIREISTKELQQFLGLSGRQSIYTWFQGKALPTLDNFYALSRYLGVSMDELVKEKGNPLQREESVEEQNFTCEVHALIRRMMTYLNGLLQMY